MKLVLLSGGSGRRLWPLSNETRSKQFLKLIQTDSGEPESMVQRVWRQLASYQWTNEVYIATNSAQAELIHSQLGEEVPLILEPQKRDTFPAVSLAVTYLRSRVGVDPDEVVIVMPVDACVEETFWEKISDLAEAVAQAGADLALIGAKPTCASTQYGYIVPEKKTGKKAGPSFYQKVARFQEKPTLAQAQTLLKQNAMWNCGVFAFRLGYMIEELRRRGLPDQYQPFYEQYAEMTPISFDYEVVEKAEKVVVVPYDGCWKDLGSWNALTEEMSAHKMGRVILDEESVNTHVINELEIPIVSIGLSDMLIAASMDGILVTSKVKSHLVKEMPLDWGGRPMYEEKRWGSYRVLHVRRVDEHTEVLTKALLLYAGKNLSYQYHRHRSEVWTIISGEGEFVLDGKLTRVAPGDVLKIPVGARHALRATRELELIEVQIGSRLTEEDIVRLAMTWEEILTHIDSGEGEDDR